MSQIYLSENTKLKTYGSSTKGEVSIIKVESETRDPYELASFLRCLNELAAEQKAAAKPKKVLRLADVREQDQ